MSGCSPLIGRDQVLKFTFKKLVYKTAARITKGTNEIASLSRPELPVAPQRRAKCLPGAARGSPEASQRPSRAPTEAPPSQSSPEPARASQNFPEPARGLPEPQSSRDLPSLPEPVRGLPEALQEAAQTLPEASPSSSEAPQTFPRNPVQFARALRRLPLSTKPQREQQYCWAS